MEHEKFKEQRDQIIKELVSFLQTKDLDYGKALIVLKDAQHHLERASLKNKI